MKKKIMLSILFGTIIIGAIIYRINVYHHDANKEILSVHGQYKKNGIPIKTITLEPQDYNIYERVSSSNNKQDIIDVYVTSYLIKKIKSGQYAESNCNNKSYEGTVLYVSNNPDINSGLYMARLKLDGISKCDKEIIHAKIGVDKYKNVIIVPNEAIVLKNNKNYVWKIINSKAKLTPIITLFSDGYNTVIDKGLNFGDVIAYQGISALKNDSFVKIISNNIN